MTAEMHIFGVTHLLSSFNHEVSALVKRTLPLSVAFPVLPFLFLRCVAKHRLHHHGYPPNRDVLRLLRQDLLLDILVLSRLELVSFNNFLNEHLVNLQREESATQQK